MKIEVDQQDLTELKGALFGMQNVVPIIRRRTINKTLTGTKTQAKKLVAKYYNLTQTRIGQNISIKNTTATDPNAWFKSTGRPIGLVSFSGTRQTAKGVSVKVLKDEQRKVIKHAFIATAKNVKNVFWRQQVIEPRKKLIKGFPYGRLPKRYRFPIIRRTGPRVEDELSKTRTIEPLKKYIGDRMVEVAKQEFNYEFSKL